MVSCSIAQTSSSATSSHNSHKQQLHSVHTKTSFSNKPPQSSSLRPSSSTQPKVYNVEPIHFRELVQSLTGATSSGAPPHSHPPPRLHRAVPPPLQLNINNNQTSRPLPSYITDAAAAASSATLNQFEDKPQPKIERPSGFTMQEPSMELSLSPSFNSLFSFPLLSPTTANLFQHYGEQLR